LQLFTTSIGWTANQTAFALMSNLKSDDKFVTIEADGRKVVLTAKEVMDVLEGK
jgi:hypothetical protein